MVTSQNGWTANDRSVIKPYSVPGGKVALRHGPPGEVLAYVASRFHREVEPLEWPGVWGYAKRLIRGSTTTISNHESGTAIDLNAPKHPLGTDPRSNFTARQIDAIHRILNDLAGIVRWGGDYVGRKDPMHFEIDAGPADVLRVWDRIQRVGKDWFDMATKEELKAVVEEVIDDRIERVLAADRLDNNANRLRDGIINRAFDIFRRRESAS